MTDTEFNVDFWNGKTVLITGGAGFIGSTLARRLLNEGTCNIVIIDSLNDYYSPELKLARLKEMGIDDALQSGNERLTFYRLNLADKSAVEEVYRQHTFDAVIHLAAQAGVRYSLVNPGAYIESNVDGFFNVLNGAAQNKIKLFLYASSSSVYGDNKDIPFKESAPFTTPLSLYAATKMSNELIAATFSHNYKMDCIGLRFFNSYGPWGRPDAVYYIWAEALRLGKPVEVRGEGKLQRDMTYIQDTVRSILGLAKYYTELDDPTRHAACEAFNIGNQKPVVIGDVLNHLAKRLDRTPQITYVDKGEEEIDLTCADTSKLQNTIGFAPATFIEDGLDAFVEWYKTYHQMS